MNYYEKTSHVENLGGQGGRRRSGREGNEVVISGSDLSHIPQAEPVPVRSQFRHQPNFDNSKRHDVDIQEARVQKNANSFVPGGSYHNHRMRAKI